VILREYLYVDVDKVRSFVAQIDGGVPEEARHTERSDRKSAGGIKGFASHERDWGAEDYVHKSLADGIFSDFEANLESLGLLRDMSVNLTEDEYWTDGGLREEAPSGSLVRITAPGAIFDARYVANVMSSFSSAVLGWGEFTPTLRTPQQVVPPRKAKGGQQNRSSTKSSTQQGNLEDLVIDFPPMPPDEDGFAVTPDMLRAVIQVARGVYQPGLHMTLTPSADPSFSVHARLQEGRRYMESDPEILFSRYGFDSQEWTIVGTIGCHSPADETAAPSGETSEAIHGDTISRKGFAVFINSFLEYFARLGFADLPQWPGFSIIPLAVYRTVPNSIDTDLMAETIQKSS
jgi:hypothetical protein